MSSQAFPAPALVPPVETVLRQRQASNPAASAWVSANAGSGKTHVLAQRVVRLLLGGVPPARILCLTFTKAAAANMSIRVFKELARWTVLDDDALGAVIAGTGAPAPSGPDLAFARRLFARTVETPGGLKIQTIHAFCERLLHLFPFEANVPARFDVLDELQAADLLLRARAAALAAAVDHGGGDLAQAVATLAAETSAATFAGLIGEALPHRAAIAVAMGQGKTRAGLTRLLEDAFGLGAGETPESIDRDMLDGGLPPAEWGEIARQLGADGKGAGKAGNRLATAVVTDAPDRLEAYLDVFLTAKREPRAPSYLAAALRRKEPALCGDLDAERDRLLDRLGRRHAARTVRRSAALITVAAAVLQHYETAKRRRGLLDFEDLVERTRNLLKRSSSAWVLYKLDRGIDHILVDEAQDTSPAQWEILQAISGDFFAGAGQARTNRTFFAVGDEKQSIYSFQGARPDMFATMRRHFQRQAAGGEKPFSEVKLLLSFRSARLVLAAVDRVFAHPPNDRGLSSDPAGPPPHEALKNLPGLVEIWPPVTASTLSDPRDWRLPVDAVDPHEPAVILAGRIADRIAAWIAPGSDETVEERRDGAPPRRRPIRPGDIMILVRSRSSFFEAMIRALKGRGVPVAGADRLALTQHIAVMDLTAAGRAALCPDDDYTLACVLKSPLVGLDDDDLIALAPERGARTLLAALGASPAPNHRAAAAKLGVWRSRSAWLTPFGFYMRLLGADGGRRDLLRRLGAEAGDAIDEFVSLTLAHEREGAPSLMAFLTRLEGADLSIKRDMEAEAQAVRVMTVHAAKGLEARIVFLPDTCGVPSGRHDPDLYRLAEAGAAETEAALLAWSPRKDEDAARVAALRAEVHRRAIEEHNRLLYVAMTRAEERLYVAGFCGEKGPPEASWYGMIAAADLDGARVPAPWDAAGTVLRLADPAPPAGLEPAASAPDTPAAAPALPDWLTHPPREEAEDPAPPVRPSNPLGAADQFAPTAWSFGDRHRSGRRDALATGRLMHKLLQHLPDVVPERRRAAGARFLDAQGQKLAPDRRAALVEQALAVLDDPALAPLFGPLSRAEVAVAARVRLPSGETIEVTGQIDRIGVDPDCVFIADYKAGTPAPETEPRHVLQLALYRAAVQPLYPDRPVRAFLVWTALPRAVEIKGFMLEAALAAIEPTGQGEH